MIFIMANNRFQNFKRIERFQASSNAANSSGTSLNEAYVAGASIANIVNPVSVISDEDNTNNTNNTDSSSGSTTILQGSKSMGFPETIWHFLGLNRLTKKQQNCSFECGMEGLNCATNCENEFTPEKRKICKYKCLQKGLKCTKTCVDTKEIEQTQPIMTTGVPTTMTTLPTTMTAMNYVAGIAPLQAQNNTIEEQQQIKAFCKCDDNSAPYDTNLWPSHHQAGWDNQTLKNYRKNQGDEQIEVLVNSNLFPLSTPNPELAFDTDSRFKMIGIQLE